MSPLQDPIHDAFVTLYLGETSIGEVKTDANGEFAFSGLTSGIYRAEISGAGFESFRFDSIDLGQQESRRLPDFHFVRVGNLCGENYQGNSARVVRTQGNTEIRGRVVSLERGSPVRAASVRIMNGGRELASVRTDFEGRFRVPIKSGYYSVNVSGSGYYAEDAHWLVATGMESGTLNIALEQCVDGACDPGKRPIRFHCE